MTDTLSLEIARFFEPEPTLKSVFWKYVTRIERSPSNMSATALDSGALAEIAEGWQPRPYADPGITARLLKWMIDKSYNVTIGLTVDADVFVVVEEQFVDTRLASVSASTMPEAVAQAAAALIRKELKNG